jgi:hypothetical protein
MQDQFRIKEENAVKRKGEKTEKEQTLLLNAAKIVLAQGDEGTKDPLDLLIAREERVIGRATVLMDSALNQRHWDEYLKAEKRDPAS